MKKVVYLFDIYIRVIILLLLYKKIKLYKIFSSSLWY